MDFHDNQSPFMTQSPADGDVIDVWPQFHVNYNEQYDMHSQFEQPPFKRSRNSESNQSNVGVPLNSRMPPPNLPVNKGTTNIFFKTRMCAKFKLGTCRNGENCNFAHGIEDMRQPPPNWQQLIGARSEDERPSGNWDEDQRIILKMKLCKKYYNGEECPYGERCNFLHEDPAKFREDSGRFRESSVISIGTTASPMMYANAPDTNINNDNNIMITPEKDKPVQTNSDVSRVIAKPAGYWKTKLCTKWETTGQCFFGEKCHFAHGRAELQFPGGRVEAEASSASSAPILNKVISTAVNDTHIPNVVNLTASGEDEQSKKCLLKWKGTKKINRIYGDWLDDLPLVHSVPSKVET